MKSYPDTSFLFAFYLLQSNSAAAAAHAKTMTEPLHVAEPLLYEFRQALRFQVWRHAGNPREGITAADAQAALSQFDADLADGTAVLVSCPLVDVFREADRLSDRHTRQGGHRSLDVLHVATARVLGAEELLTFDGNQRRLATAEGLRVGPEK